MNVKCEETNIVMRTYCSFSKFMPEARRLALPDKSPAFRFFRDSSSSISAWLGALKHFNQKHKRVGHGSPFVLATSYILSKFPHSFIALSSNCFHSDTHALLILAVNSSRADLVSACCCCAFFHLVMIECADFKCIKQMSMMIRTHTYML